MRRSVYTICAAIGAALVMNMTACGSGAGNTSTEQTGETTSGAETTEAETAAETEQVDLNEVLEAVKDAYGSDYLPDTAIDETTLAQTFGIDSGLYEEFVGEMPAISTHVDTFLAVRAADGQGETVEELLNAYRNSQIESAVQYPMNMPKLKASKVVRYGDDVYFVMLGAYDDSTEDEDQLVAVYESQTQIGLDMIDSFYE